MRNKNSKLNNKFLGYKRLENAPTVKCNNCGHVITIYSYMPMEFIICNKCANKVIVNEKKHFRNEILRRVGKYEYNKHK